MTDEGLPVGYRLIGLSPLQITVDRHRYRMRKSVTEEAEPDFVPGRFHIPHHMMIPYDALTHTAKNSRRVMATERSGTGRDREIKLTPKKQQMSRQKNLKTSTNVLWIRNWRTLLHMRLTDAACALTSWQHVST